MSIERIAIPKKGRVYERVLQLMLDAGFKMRREGRRDFSICRATGCEVYFLPAKDIPNAVASGAIQYGITGLDLIENAHADVDVHFDLGIGKAKMVVASPDKSDWNGPQSLNGKRIGTSYTELTRKYLDTNGVKDYKLVHFEGSVEIQVSLGVVDAIVDITETGSSLVANRLLARDTIVESEMVLMGAKGHQGPILDLLMKRFRRVLRGRSHAMLKFNLPESKLEEAYKLNTGLSSPTVNHLAEKEWVAVEVALNKKDLHEIMDQLIELGATGILAHDLSFCVPVGD